jgi:hypothetical protein
LYIYPNICNIFWIGNTSILWYNHFNTWTYVYLSTHTHNSSKIRVSYSHLAFLLYAYCLQYQRYMLEMKMANSSISSESTLFRHFRHYWIKVRAYRRDNQKATIQRNWQHTRRRKTKQKLNTICVGQHHAQTNRNNIHDTSPLTNNWR